MFENIIASINDALYSYILIIILAALGDFGTVFITIAMILFAFTTLLGNLFYVDKALCYILNKKPGKVFNTIYYIIASLLIFLGSGLSADLLWNIADITMGAMTLINMPVITILSKYVIRALNNYTEQRKNGIEPFLKLRI